MAALMLTGTGSDVGKSLLAAGLCRAYTRRGLTVRPFKPQNMSNNAAVTENGGEIGRAQALQARACGAAPHTDMNPVLLKPQDEVGAQLVVHGRARGSVNARDYQNVKVELMAPVLASFDRLRTHAELVIVEGAGSISEINLRAGDIANMGFALASRTPVVLVGDIDRGGVIAAVVGSRLLLDEGERALLRGYLINKFRGDIRLFDGGIEVIGRHTGLPCLGVVPFFPAAARLPAEDAVGAAGRDSVAAVAEPVRVAVPLLARIANLDDLDPLRAEPDVTVSFIEPGRALPGDADLIVLPGSKATRADLAFLRRQGWDIDIQAHLRRGGWLLGLCGGYQMLGRRVADPHGVEGGPGESQGLDYLQLDTELRSAGSKTLTRIEGRELASGLPVSGYEIHTGVSRGAALERPLLSLGKGAAAKPDGAVSADGKILGCYLHGLFTADAWRQAFLRRLRQRADSGLVFERLIDDTLDQLAEHLEAHLDLDALLRLARAAP